MRSASAVMFATFGAILALSAAQSRATVLPNGGTVAGWTISWNAGITVQFSQADNTILILQKTANFVVNTGSLITFVQSGTTGVAPKIEFNGESLTNSSGTTWGGFEFELLTTLGSPETFEGPAGIFVPPSGAPSSAGVNYTSASFSSTDIVYTGTQPTGTTSRWGIGGDSAGGSGGLLVIDTHATSSGTPAVFTLKEIPLVSSVPLPSGAAQAVVGFMGLGMLGLVSKFKKLVA